MIANTQILKVVTGICIVLCVSLSSIYFVYFKGQSPSEPSISIEQLPIEQTYGSETHVEVKEASTFESAEYSISVSVQNPNVFQTLCVGNAHRLVGFEMMKFGALTRSATLYIDSLELENEKHYAREYLSNLGIGIPTGISLEKYISYEHAEKLIPVEHEDVEEISSAINKRDFQLLRKLIDTNEAGIYVVLQFMELLPSDVKDEIFSTYGFGNLRLLKHAIVHGLAVEEMDYLLQYIPNYSESWTNGVLQNNALTFAMWAEELALIEYFLDKNIPMYDDSLVSLEDILRSKYQDFGKEKTSKIIKLLSENGYQWTDAGINELRQYVSPSETPMRPLSEISSDLMAIINLNQVWTHYVVEKHENCSQMESLLQDQEVLDIARDYSESGMLHQEVEKALNLKSKLYVEILRIHEELNNPVNEETSQAMNEVSVYASSLIASDSFSELESFFNDAGSSDLKASICYAAIQNKVSVSLFKDIFADFFIQNPKYMISLGVLNALEYIQVIEQGGINIKGEYGYKILYFAVMADAFDVFDYLINDIVIPQRPPVGLNALEYYILSDKKWDSHRESQLFEKYAALPGIASIREER